MTPLRGILLTFGLVGLAVLGAASAAATGAVEVDQATVCLECHDDLAEQIARDVAHPPASGGDCTSCHNPHVSRNEALLLSRPAILCAECHAEVTEELSRAEVHAPVAEGRCGDCHEPHGGSHGGLLVRPGVELCTSCHAEVESWRQLPIQHSPFRRGRCADCHEPHGADAPGLLTATDGSACTRCHPASTQFFADHGGYPVLDRPCSQCHDPHASQRAGLFREVLHAPFEAGACDTCHVAPTADDPFALQQRMDQLCGDCHGDQVEQARTAVFPHVAGGGGNCTECHNPHAADGRALLSDEPARLCLDCHDPGGARSGEPGRYLTHAEDLECTTCHAPHGGERPQLFTEDSVELCGTCHSHEHGVRHPLGEDVRDPRNGAPMTCLSCHGIHRAPAKMYLHASEERELCLSCHKEIGS